MPNNDIFLDGVGKFQQNSENAGAIKFGEFSQATINTGNIAVSALFTGTSVNSGTIGNFLPYATSVLVQSNSANWNAAYEAIGTSSSDVVTLVQTNSAQWDLAFAAADAFNTDPRLTDAREPLAHTQAISTIDGLEDVLATLESNGGQQGLPAISASDIIGFDDAAQSIATGVIAAAAGNSIASLVDGLIPSSQLPSYVDEILEYEWVENFPNPGESSKIYVSTALGRIFRWSGTSYIEIASPNIPVQSVAGKYGEVALYPSDIIGLGSALEDKANVSDLSNYVTTSDSRLTDARDPLTHVHAIADVTGLQTALDDKQVAGSYAASSHTHSTSDITGFTAALTAAAPVKSVAGKTGTVTLSTSDITGLQTALDTKQASGSYATTTVTNALSSAIAGAVAAAATAAPVQSVAGKTGTVTLETSDINGLDAALLAASQGSGGGGAISITSSDVSDFDSAVVALIPVQSVAGKTGTVTLSTSDIQGLQTALDAKQASGSYATTTVTNALSTAIDGKQVAGSYAASSHTHAITAVTGLQAALDAKQASGSYATTTITTALSTAIDGKQASGSYAASSHTHSTADITGFTAAVSAAAPVKSVAGKTGTVTLSSSDITGLSAAVVLYTPAVSIPVTSVAGRTGAVVVSASDVYGFSAAADARITAAAGVSVASLVGGFVPSAQLPSYVDDVVEYSSYAALTAATGETGKIYVDTTVKKIYRWSGSAYVEISPSPGSTDSVTEGSTNLYYTSARASAAAPVQSVAGKTGTVTLSTSDILGLSANSTTWNAVYTTVNTNSAEWEYNTTLLNSNSSTWSYNTTLLNANSAKWNTTYTTVTANSAAWNYNTTLLNSNSAAWGTTYTTVNANSASWSNGNSTNFGAISATSISLSSSMLSTYSTPVTASGDFLVLSVGNKQRLIRIWDFI